MTKIQETFPNAKDQILKDSQMFHFEWNQWGLHTQIYFTMVGLESLLKTEQEL